jgi:uncharacterized membrane protein (DUF106 family)
MNKFLSKALPVVNAIIAGLIIWTGGAAGGAFAETTGILGAAPPILGFIIGLFFPGLILAILICGTVALFINIRDEIVLANKSLNDLKKEQR